MLKRVSLALAGFTAALLMGTGTAPAAEGPITLGISAPLELQYGRDAIDGARMAIDEINAKGGVLGQQIRLVTADEGSSVQQGVAAVRKLISDDKVNAVIGGGNSGVALAEIQHVAASKTLFLGINAASPQITDLLKRDREKYKYFFRTSPLNSYRQAASYIDFGLGVVKKELGFEKVALVAQNARFLQPLMPVLKAGLEKGGMKVTMVELFDSGMSDFSPIFSRVQSSGAQFMMVFMVEANSDAFVKQWYDVKLPIPIGGLDVKGQDTDFFKRIGGKAVSEIVANQFAHAPITAKTMPFWNAFHERYHREPVYTAAGAYDAVYLYADAAARAKSIETDSLITALESAKYTGVQGGIAFDDLHDVKDGPGGINTTFSQWRPDGSREVVWPAEIATAKPILPPWMNAATK